MLWSRISCRTGAIYPVGSSSGPPVFGLPEKPPMNLAIMAMYVFQPVIFKALKQTPPGRDGEIQLTDAIQKLIDLGLNVYAVKLSKDYKNLDIGSPERYWDALSLSYQHFCRRQNR